MCSIEKTVEFDKWLRKLKDLRAKAKILFRIQKIAQETGLSRPSLYKALSAGAKPQFETIMKVLRAIGGQIQINPMTT